MYPWVQYTTNDVIMEYLHPYINYGVLAVIDVSFACFFTRSFSHFENECHDDR